MPSRIVFLKLGGSLITDKSAERSARTDLLKRLAHELAEARRAAPDTRVVLGHGSGSFGHRQAARYGTAGGVRTADEWNGFVEVWRAADALNRIVLDALADADLPAVRFPPSAEAVQGGDGRLVFSADNIRRALEAGLIPVVFGDAVFNRERGGGIASTEDVFTALCGELKPERILLAGIERGVYKDYPACRERVSVLHAGEMNAAGFLGGSAQVDVTGGMRSKVEGMLDLVRKNPGLRVLIFSGEPEGCVRRAVCGEAVEGTWLEK